MDESRITAMSQPFVVVFFEQGFNGPCVGDPISTTYQNLSDSESERNSGNTSDTGQDSYAGNVGINAGIVSLTAEGIMPTARKCTIKFVDPTLEITNQIMSVSKWSNGPSGRGKPNIKIVFGWKYLRVVSGRQTNVSECAIHAYMLKTKFDINEYGITEIEIETLELGSLTSGSATWLLPKDISNWFNVKSKFTDSTFFDTVTYKNDSQSKPTGIIDTITAHDFSNFINNSDSLKQSVGVNDSGKANIQFVFAKPNFQPATTGGLSLFGATGGSGNSLFNDVKIAFNETFEDFINDVLTKIPFTKGLTGDNKNGSYQIVSTYYDRTDKVSKIVYDWRRNIVNGDGDVIKNNMNALTASYTLRWGNEELDTESSAVNNYQVDTSGYSPRSSIKYILNWSSDLNSKTYLHYLAQNKFKKLLTQYTTESLEKYQSDLNSGNETDPQKRLPYTQSPGKNVSGFSDQVNTALKDVSDSVKAQFAAIVAENVFKATATIIGDPWIGEGIVPFKHKMHTDFSSTQFMKLFGLNNATNLAAFSKDWMLMKVTHHIESGSYTTDLELLTAPNLDSSATPPQKEKSASGSSGSATSTSAE